MRRVPSSLARVARFGALAFAVAVGGGACGGDDGGGGAATDGAVSTDVAGDAGPGPEPTVADADATAGMDPEILALAELPEEEFCALLAAEDVEDLTGTTPAEPTYSRFEALGTNCIYYTPDDPELLAKVEVGLLSYADYAAIATLDLGDGRQPPPAQPCGVDGRDALCAEPYTDEEGLFSTGYQVIVPLGTDADPYLLVELQDEEAALAGAATVLSRLP